MKRKINKDLINAIKMMIVPLKESALLVNGAMTMQRTHAQIIRQGIVMNQPISMDHIDVMLIGRAATVGQKKTGTLTLNILFLKSGCLSHS